MFSKKYLVFCFLILSSPFLKGQIQYPSVDLNVSERYPGNDTSLSITLGANSTDGYPLSGHYISDQPDKGTLDTSTGTSYNYVPDQYNEASDEFLWTAFEDNGTDIAQVVYKVVINVIPVNNPPIFSNTVQPSYTVDENLNVVAQIAVIDYDSDASAGNLNLFVRENSNPAYSSHDNLFETQYSSKNGASYFFNIVFKNGITPNFEAPPLGTKSYTFDLNATDDAGGSPNNETVTITIEDVNEAPEIKSPISYTRSLTEGEDTDKEDFQPIQINAEDPEPVSEGGGVVYWMYTVSDTTIGGDVVLNNTTTLTRGQMSPISFTSNTNIDFDYYPDEDDYGTQTITITAYDAVDPGDGLQRASADSIEITFNIARVDDDPISLNETSDPISIAWDENEVGTLHDFNPTDVDSSANANILKDLNTSTEGAMIFYTISGEDEEFFQISSNGLLTFISPPDFENPVDQTGGASNSLEGNNIYQINVKVRDRSDPSSNLVNTDDVDVVVTVSNVNETPYMVSGQMSYSITVTEDSVWTWNDPQDVLSQFSLTANDVDSGHADSLSWSMKSGSDGTYGTAVIDGNGTEPSSFSYTPIADYFGLLGDDSFTVQVKDSNDTTIELDFNVTFIAENDPPLLDYITPTPLENISRNLDVYTIHLDENNPATVRVDYDDVDGDPIQSIVFEGGDQILDNEDFNMTVDLVNKYVEVFFKPGLEPDFEAPADDDGDGIYSVKLKAIESTGDPLLTQLNFVIQDVDDSPTLSNDINFSPTVLENQTFVSTLSGNDPEGVTSFYWKISPKYDYGKFQLDLNDSTPSATSTLSFRAAPDFEDPLDGSELGEFNNTYVVEVQMKDALIGGKTAYGTFYITVSDDNDFPKFILSTPTSIQINEGELTVADMNLTQWVTDEDNLGGAGPDDLIWQKAGGDTTAFSINQNSGILSFSNLSFSDYESQSQYNITMKVFDQRGGYAESNFSIELQDNNEAPQFFENNESNSQISFLRIDLNEDNTTTEDLLQYVRDPDGNGVTFHFDNGVDYNGTLQIALNSGSLVYTPTKNYRGITYATVNVRDDHPTDSKDSNITIEFHVADISDAPAIREGSSATLIGNFVSKSTPENNLNWSMELNASDLYDDPPAEELFWTLSGDDATKFKLTPSEGNLTSLTLRSPPNYEDPDDNNTDYTYEVTVHITDSDNSSDSFDLELTYSDIDEDAIFDYGDGNNSVVYKHAGQFEEATTHPNIFQVKARDVDESPSPYATPIIYGFTDSAFGNDNDPSVFSIDQDTGLISIISPLNFEDGQGSFPDDNNTYVLEVNATSDSDDPDQIRHYVYLTITNVVEDPYFVLNTDSNSSDENLPISKSIVFGSDDINEDSLVLEISGGADQSYFSINTATKILTFNDDFLPDFEDPQDSDKNNLYEVQVGIVGTNITQDITWSVLAANDAPVILNTGLSQIIVEENTGFVVDIEVSDQDSETHRFDLLFHTSDNEIRYISHSGDDTSLSTSYEYEIWSEINNSYFPTRLVHGDFNRDGYEDLIVIEKSMNGIQYFLYDHSSTAFVHQANLNGSTSDTGPGFAMAHDIDQDGDLDLLVAFVGTNPNTLMWYKNDSGNFTRQPDPLWSSSDSTASGQELLHFAIGDMNGDSFDDLVLARRTGNGGDGRVSLVLNSADPSDIASFENSANTEFGADFGIVKPSFIELADMNGSGALDILVASEDAITLLDNNGTGTNDKLSVISENIGQFDGDGIEVKAYDVTADGLLDIVYTTNDLTDPTDVNSRVKLLIQNESGSFDEKTSPFSPSTEDKKKLNRPQNIQILPAKGDVGVCIIFNDSTHGYLTLYETRPSNDGTFEDPLVLVGSSTPDDATTINSIELVDLDRYSERFTYSLSGLYDLDDFSSQTVSQSRFRDSGKLYFKKPPDHEDPTDGEPDNFYKVKVVVTDQSGASSSKDVTVYVKDVNDPPVIESTSTYGKVASSSDWSYPLEVPENWFGEIAQISASNDEENEEITYTIVRGTDESFFDIDTNGSLYLIQPLNYEIPEDANQDGNYTVIVRATDNGVNPGYDEQNITITIENGSDAPVFGQNVTNYAITEDTSLNIDLNLTDDLANPTPGPGIEKFVYQGLENGTISPTTVTIDNSTPEYSFTYVPDSNFTGVESFTIVAVNFQDLNDTLDVNVTVVASPDRPVILSTEIIEISESKQNVVVFQAVDDDDDSSDLVWSWANQGASDPIFDLNEKGLLQFRDVNGIDFEGMGDQIVDFIPTDAVNLVLWLDADDNQTLYDNDDLDTLINPDNNGSRVGGWIDKSGKGNHLLQADLTSSPYLSTSSINSKTALEFENNGTSEFLEADKRLGLDENPDLLIFAVTHVGANIASSDEILQIGNSPSGFLLASAGTDGWSWRFGDGYLRFSEASNSVPTVKSQTGIQVWEHPSGGDYASSKFYYNGVEQLMHDKSNSAESPRDSSDKIILGNGFNGLIGEIIVLNSVDTNDRVKLEGYLARKWGLTNDLSTDHPYRYNRPAHIKWERSVRVTDSEGNFTDSNFTIRVTNLNDNSPTIHNAELQSSNLIQRYESSELLPSNHTIIDFNVSDIDGDNVEIEIFGGNDQSFFDLDGSVLFFSSNSSSFPNFESPIDTDKDNIYEVEILFLDGNPSNSISLFLRVEIINANEDPPSFVNNGQIVNNLDLNVSENNKTVAQLTTIDDWTGPIYYSITGGVDDQFFEINASDGSISFRNLPNEILPDFESPADDNSDNIYEVEVTATDDGNYSTPISLKIQVLDVNEPPGLGFSLPVEVAEDSSVTFSMQIFDPEDVTKTIYPFEWPPKTSPQHGSFTDAGQGNYTYTPKANYNGTDLIVITVNDQDLQKDFNITIQVNSVPDKPTAVDDIFTIESFNGEPIALNVLYNDSNLPDANNTVGLEVVSSSLPDLNLTADGMILYSPDSTFIGVDSFSYTMKNYADLNATAKVKVYVKQNENVIGWRFLEKFGYYMENESNWIFHAELGWLYVVNPQMIDSSTWMWNETLGWFWTGNKYAPDAYLNDFARWFTFTSKPDEIFLSWPVYDQTDKRWLNQGSFQELQFETVVQKVIDDISEMSTEEKILYIENSIHFTVDQKNAIKFEFLFDGYSRTLTSLAN